jgi:outer membrane protein assembly factor BamB
VSAADGKLLWRAPREGKTAVIPTPVIQDGTIFVTSGYNVGHHAFQVTASGGAFTAKELYSGKEMTNHHGGVIRVGDHVYGTSDARPGGLTCIELKTGKVAWQNPGVGKGSVAYADGHLYVRGERSGAIALVEATPSGYKEKGRFDQPERSKDMAWPHPVVVGGRLYVRDQDNLFCYDVKARSETGS